MHVYLYVDKYMYVGQFFGAFYFLRFMVIHVILCTFCFSRFQSILSFYPIHYFMYLALKIEFRLYSIDNTVDNKPNPISGGTSHLPVHIRHFIIYFFFFSLAYTLECSSVFQSRFYYSALAKTIKNNNNNNYYNNNKNNSRVDDI